MGKNRSKAPAIPESHFDLPAHSSFKSDGAAPSFVDTHTHLLSTFTSYRSKYPDGKHLTVHDFARGLYRPPNGKHAVGAIVDVWCDAPVVKQWKELADSALTKEQRDADWGGLEYWFVMGVHPHNAKDYDDKVEADIIEAMSHPRCVGWGEMGLDYHYNNSPPAAQRDVLIRQLRCAVKLGKSLTIHTREADEDIERILKAEVPKDHKIHIHCFTDTPELAQRLLGHFPNLCIGITGVITYTTNANTSAVIQNMSTQTPKDSGASSSRPLRIVLETDAPYMVPNNIYASLKLPKSNSRLAFSHSGMIPWTAEFVANLTDGQKDADRVLWESNENAKLIYGV